MLVFDAAGSLIGRIAMRTKAKGGYGVSTLIVGRLLSGLSVGSKGRELVC